MSEDLKALFEKDAVDASSIPDGDKLTTAREMAHALYELDIDIKNAEARLEALKKERQEVVQRKLPGYLDSIGLDKVGLPEADADIVVENYYHANIPEEYRDEAHAWLEENGHGDLIKTVLTVQFHRGEVEIASEVARRIAAFIKAKGLPERPSEVKKGVQWNTLTAFVKEQIEVEQAVLPLKILGATVGRIVKIKPRSKGKRK